MGDERPLISDLLSENLDAIEAVRVGILADDVGQHLYNKGDNSKLYDDVWILRFVLSQKSNVKSATKAALATMKFRDEKKLNELGDIRHMIKNFGGTDVTGSSSIGWLPRQELFNTCCKKDAIFNFLPDKDRGIIVIVDIGMINMHKAAKEMGKEDFAEVYLYMNESLFQILDFITRSTGRLTKLVKIVDMGNAKLSTISYDYAKQDAAAAKITEDFYPQTLGMVCTVNSPGWLSSMWKMLRPIFPKRVVEKVHFLPSVSKMGKSKEGLKPILKYISEEDLPKKYGGRNNEWPLPAAGERFVKKRRHKTDTGPGENLLHRNGL